MSKFMLGYAGVAALLLAVSACSEDNGLATVQDESPLRHITVTAKDFETDADTRTNFAITSSGAEFSWAANDTVGIFPETGAQAYFPMTSGAGTKSAAFSGGGWALKASSTYAAYYPFVGNFYLNRNAVPVNYAGQTQNGDASTAHLGAYDYMAAAPVTPTGSSASFAFEHLGSLVQLKLTLPQATTLLSVSLSTEEALFATEGKVDLMAAQPVITATSYTSSINLDLKEISTTAADQTLTLYMMLPPTDLTSKTLTITATHQTAQKAVATIAGKNLQAGRAYAFSVTMPTVEDLTTVNVTEAGTLSTLIGDNWNKITCLSISGPLNGDDIRLIREMAGRDKDDNSTDGVLTTLDLSKASIVSGGGSYYKYSWNTTTDNEIGEYMFRETNLLSISLPLSVNAIGNNAFYECNKLTEVVIPDNVISIGDYAFYYCDHLEQVKLSENLKSIGRATFEACKRLKSIELPKSLTSIGEWVFDSCERLTSITIPEGIKTIGEYSFRWCYELTSVSLPSTMTEIGEYAFIGCKKLSSINLPSSISRIGNYAFSGCYILPNITFPASLKTIGNEAFCRCWSMTKIVLPDNLTDIGDNAFYYLTSLTELTIGKSVKSIGYEAFKDAPLTTVTCYPTIPPTLYDDVFTPQSDCKFNVPKGCKEAYESSSWSKYFPTATEMTE